MATTPAEPAPGEPGCSKVAELAAAWERGERPTAADLLEQSPGLDDEAAIRLIYEEACLRREAGLEVDTSEVVRRYPRWGEDLRALFACDRLLRPSGAAAAFPEVGEALGPFRLVDELGRGASGRTYLAIDPTLADRPVVLKVISADEDEHLALASLRHTHIVPLFSEHAFPDRGLRGLCMPCLGGTSLAQVLKDLATTPLGERSGRLILRVLDRYTRPATAPPPADGPFRRGLEASSYVSAMTWIGACLADALQYAHARGMVHMDLKPSNVLITADGQPMLLDFHLARAPIVAGEMISGRLGGTPGWMSPEQEAAMPAFQQRRHAPANVDGRSDIYALGLLLREALQLGPAGGATFRRPPAIPLALADIVRTCLAPDPRDRYPDAASLAEDLRRQLSDLPLRGIRNRSLVERMRKWRRRHPGARAWGVAAAAVLLGAAIALAAAATVYGQRIGQVEAALEDGRKHRLSGRWDEAIRILQRARPNVASIPFVAGLGRALDEETRLARSGQAAEELHRLADVIRFRYGIDPPSRDEAVTLDRLCRIIWERRADLLITEGRPIDRASAERIRTDLLEIAAVGADLRIQVAPSGETDLARREALRLLEDAEATLGPSFALDLRRADLAGAAENRLASDKPAHEPRSAWEHYDLGRYRLRSGQIEAAWAAFRRAVELRPQDFWPSFYDGLCAYRLGHFDEAVAAFRACLALQPTSAICHYNRALASTALGRDDARRDYTQAIALDPNLAAAFLNRGILAYKEGKFLDAIADFERGLSAHPDRATLGRLHYNLALAQIARGDRAGAAVHIAEARSLGCPEAEQLRGDRPEVPSAP